MASQKRRAEDDSDDDVSSATSSSTESHSESRKRRRVSQDSETTPEQDQSRRRGVRGSHSIRNLTDESSDDEEAEQAATQVVREKRLRDKDQENVPREYGVLQRVEVHDFMNHHYFQFDLGPLINFICGKNGSGKSALLTAIIICLGGKASSTSRGNSLKKFIREGCERAKIICTIKNEGEDAYMHAEFGDRIVVERHFNQSGTSGFSIKSASGRIYSHKRADLDPILDHCNLQMDNPLNVLTQDSAREFLHKSSPSDKYKFFLKGVQLEQLDQDYRLIDEQLSNIEPRLDRKQEDVQTLQQVMEHKNEQRDTARRRAGLKEKARAIRRQIIWIQVQTQENIVADYSVQVDELKAKLMELQSQVDALEVVHQAAIAACDVSEAALAQANAVREGHNDEKRELKSKFDDAKSELYASQAELRTVKDTLEANKRDTEKKKQEIEAEQRHIEEVNGDGPARRQRQLAEAQTAAQETRQAYESHVNARRQLDQDAELKKARIAETQTTVKESEDRVNSAREKLVDLRNKARGQWANFPKGTEQLVQLINQETRFHHKPIGPIGKHVRLLKSEWASILETAFGKTLSTFITFDRHDHHLLNDLKARAKCHHRVEVAQIQRTLFDLREPDAQFDTVLRALEIDDPYVKKHLVIQHAIEQYLLISDLKTATSTMYDRGRLYNVRGCYTHAPGEKNRGMLLRYSADGSASQDPVAAWEEGLRMQIDQQAVMDHAQQALQDAQDELQRVKDIWQTARADSVRAEQSKVKHGKRQNELKIAFQKADDEVDRLRAEIEEDQVDNGKLTELQRLLAEYESQQALVESQFKDAVNDCDTKKNAMRARQSEMAAYDSTIEKAEQDYSNAQKALREADRKKQKALLDKNGVLATHGDAQSDLRSSEELASKAEAALTEIVEKAREQCERVEIPAGAIQERLVAKYEKLNKDYRDWQRQVGFSIEEAEEAAVIAKKAFEQAQKDYEDLKESKDMLELSLKDRRARWKKFRRFITVRARVTFVALLSERGFRGELLLNHEKHLLDLRVEPDITKSSAAGRSARTLSGGEKSFSQICMLLAMWEAMGSPIRCLDEFDVFMDAVNRSLSIKMIIEAARTSVGKQYILISPGSKTDIERAPDVHALELVPPERGQQTLEVSNLRSRR